MNIFPTDGKIVILDDVVNEVKPLMRLLSANGSAFSFFTEVDGQDLPAQPLLSIRLIFLDLQLTGTTQNTKGVISTVGSRLTRIVSENNGPYVIVVWSSHVLDHYTEVESEIMNGNSFSKIRPLAMIPLGEKADLLQDDSPYDKIHDMIVSRLEEKEALYRILEWENLVLNSASKTIVNLFANPNTANGNWNSNAMFTFFKLAAAQLGKRQASNRVDFDAAFKALNQVLVDQVEEDTSRATIAEGNLSTNANELFPFEVSAINRKLLISSEASNRCEPGCVYLGHVVMDSEILAASESNPKGVRKLSCSIVGGKPELLPKSKKFIWERSNFSDLIDWGTVKGAEAMLDIDPGKWSVIKKRQELFKEHVSPQAQAITLNITPICDFAQQKALGNRLIHGWLFPKKYVDYIARGARLYFEKIFIRHQERDFVLIFDFRSLFNLSDDLIPIDEFLFRIKHQLLSDIQGQLSAHVNRTGVYYLS